MDNKVSRQKIDWIVRKTFFIPNFIKRHKQPIIIWAEQSCSLASLLDGSEIVAKVNQPKKVGATPVP
jgi:hypothetical protein